MKTEDLKISVEDKVATFTFNRLDKFNATVPKFNTLAFNLHKSISTFNEVFSTISFTSSR